MATDEDFDIDEENEKAYDDLIVAVEASEGVLSLFLAVCDSPQLRAETIGRYEKELQPTIRPYRIELPTEEPSLRKAIAETVANDPYLQSGGRAVLTVLGAERLSFLRMGEERSQQEIFFGYLQWTREALREFPYPIILWLTNQMFAELSRKAPDFWSWRKDVFRFRSKKTIMVPSWEVEPLRPIFAQLEETGVREEDSIPIDDLRQLIFKTKESLRSNQSSPLLATLYQRMGCIYKGRLDRGEAQSYQEERETGIKYLQKAIDIQQALELKVDLANSLGTLAALYRIAGRYADAELLYLQSLSIMEQQLGATHLDVAKSLNDLVELYRVQQQNAQAEPLAQHSLSIMEQQLGANHPEVANSLNNLAGLYYGQERYAEAEALYRQSLSIREQQLGASHPDVARSLNNLAMVYNDQRRYQEAELLYLRALSILEQQLGATHPDVARSLFNLATLYYGQERYAEAEALYRQSLSIREQQLGASHPDVANCLNSLAAIYKRQRRYTEAESLYLRSLEIREKTLGVNDFRTEIVRQRLERLRQKIRSLRKAKSSSSSEQH